MPLLNLFWLGLGPLVASTWQLLLLGGASWLLARILAWICVFYTNCCRLRCFPQPPKRNWFWGHLGMMQGNEEGLPQVAELGHYFRAVHLWWVGPVFPILKLIHPKFIAPLLQASAVEVPKEMSLYGYLKPWLGQVAIPGLQGQHPSGHVSTHQPHDFGQSAEMCLQLQQQLSGAMTPQPVSSPGSCTTWPDIQDTRSTAGRRYRAPEGL